MTTKRYTQSSSTPSRSGQVGATELATTGAPVSNANAAPPTTGQVLTATSSTTSAWRNPIVGAQLDVEQTFTKKQTFSPDDENEAIIAVAGPTISANSGKTGIRGTGADAAGPAYQGGTGLEGIGGVATGNDGIGVKGTGGGTTGIGVVGTGGGVGGGFGGIGGNFIGGSVESIGVVGEGKGGSYQGWSGIGVKGVGGSGMYGIGVYGLGGSGAGSTAYGIYGRGGDSTFGSGSPGVYALGGTAYTNMLGATGVEGHGGAVSGDANGGIGIYGVGSAKSGSGTIDGIGAKGTGGGTTGTGVYGVGATQGYGVVAEATVTSPVRAALHLVPQDIDPSSAQMGDLYANTDGTLRFYNGATWKTVAFTA